MAVRRTWVPVAPEEVWAIVADPRAYAFWVVGSHDIRGVEGDWPAVGATFHHTQGHGPFKLADTTTVERCEAPRRLRLEVRARPFAVGTVDLTLDADGDGTCITMDERVHGGLAGPVPGALLAPLLLLRNEHALRRLAGMAWSRAARPGRRVQGADGSGTTPRSSASATKARA